MDGFARIVLLVLAMFVYAGFTAVTEKLARRDHRTAATQLNYRARTPRVQRQAEAFVADNHPRPHGPGQLFYHLTLRTATLLDRLRPRKCSSMPSSVGPLPVPSDIS